jgi:exodeoxyribonuclease VII small subunit
MSEKTLETLFKELDEIVTKLEDENVSLEESFKTYNQGMELLKACNEKIDVIEKKMKVLDENGEEHEF